MWSGRFVIPRLAKGDAVANQSRAQLTNARLNCKTALVVLKECRVNPMTAMNAPTIETTPRGATAI